jgi:nucleoside-diphosphate-sugar epimerase
MPKALVTGGSGFIGSSLIRDLAERGYEVRALLRKTSDTSHLEGIRYERADGDLSNFEALKKAVEGVDVVFHLAGVVRAPSRDGFFKHNAEGTRLLAEAVAAVNPGLRRFVLVSSLAAAGPATCLEKPNLESHEATPVSLYGESKLQGEREALKFKDRFPVTVIRPPMVYGPRDKDIFVVIRTVSRRMMPMIQGATPDGSKYYSLIHVSDLCRGIIQAGEASAEKVPSGEIFYLTDGGLYTYRDLLLAMAASLGVRAFEMKIPAFVVSIAASIASALGALIGKTFPLNRDKMNEILPDYWICSTEKAKLMLGYSPKYNLSTGMADAIQWYRERKWI